MKTKLTISMERDLVPVAKQYARRRGLSLSALIEEDLRQTMRSSGGFSKRWLGRLTLAGKDEERYRRLVEKHG